MDLREKGKIWMDGWGICGGAGKAGPDKHSTGRKMTRCKVNEEARGPLYKCGGAERKGQGLITFRSTNWGGNVGRDDCVAACSFDWRPN
jgi:hypothetical protein